MILAQDGIDPFSPFIFWRLAGAALFILLLLFSFGVGVYFVLKLARIDRKNRDRRIAPKKLPPQSNSGTNLTRNANGQV